MLISVHVCISYELDPSGAFVTQHPRSVITHRLLKACVVSKGAWLFFCGGCVYGASPQWCRRGAEGMATRMLRRAWRR
eukprot:gene8924-biopygen6700